MKYIVRGYLHRAWERTIEADTAEEAEDKLLRDVIMEVRLSHDIEVKAFPTEGVKGFYPISAEDWVWICTLHGRKACLCPEESAGGEQP